MCTALQLNTTLGSISPLCYELEESGHIFSKWLHGEKYEKENKYPLE